MPKIGLFARVPSPGQPEGIVVAPGGTVYVGSDAGPFIVRPDGSPPSKLFAYSPQGRLRRSYLIKGQDHSSFYGLFGLALDHAGLVYAVDHSPARIITIDPRTGRQRDYARFRDVPRCLAPVRTTDCSDTQGDMGSFPNFAVFAPDGTMYVTDTSQALIWRVPRGGGRPTVWYTDPGLESVFGPNGAEFLPDGRTLMFVQSLPGPDGPSQRSSGLYTIPVLADGRPGRLKPFWRTTAFDSPDGFQITRSGNIYVTAAGANQVVVLSSRGQEIARMPTPQENSAMEVPFNQPANVAFLGGQALVTNHAYIDNNPRYWAVLSIATAERAIPYFRPDLRPALHLAATPTRVMAGRRVRIRFRVSARVRGRPVPLAGALIRFAGRRFRADRRGRATIVLRFRARGRRRARASRLGYRGGVTFVRVARQPRSPRARSVVAAAR